MNASNPYPQYLSSGDFLMEMVTWRMTESDCIQVRLLWQSMRGNPATHWPQHVRVRLFESQFDLPPRGRLTLVVEYREDGGAALRLSGRFVTYALRRRFNAMIDPHTSTVQSVQLSLVSMAPQRTNASVPGLSPVDAHPHSSEIC